MVKTRSADKGKHKPEDEENVKGPEKKIKRKTKGKIKENTQMAKEIQKDSHKGHKTHKTAATAEKKVMHESSLIEKGHIYFFYRPKVELHEVHDVEDVQKVYIILRPQVEVKGPVGKNRLIVLGKKKLPIPKKHDRFWAFVDAVSDNIYDITQKLDPATYETATRGERHLEGCRPCGCGVYSIVHHLEGVYRSNQHTHLAYVLEVPEKIGPVQESFNISNEGSFIITVKNPNNATSQGLSTKQRVHYPKELQDKFADRKFTPAEPASLLDYEGVEFLLIGAKYDIVMELGDVGKDLEQTAEEEELESMQEAGQDDHRCNLAEEQVFHALHMHHNEHPAKPLITGKWE